MLEVRHLTKYYSAIAAIRDVSFSVAPGTIVGLLGPNGSGKSTTVSILTGLREASEGEVWFNGSNIAPALVEYKARVGYVPEEAHLYSFLSGREHLQLVGRLRRIAEPLLTQQDLRAPGAFRADVGRRPVDERVLQGHAAEGPDCGRPAARPRCAHPR